MEIEWLFIGLWVGVLLGLWYGSKFKNPNTKCNYTDLRHETLTHSEPQPYANIRPNLSHRLSASVRNLERVRRAIKHEDAGEQQLEIWRNLEAVSKKSLHAGLNEFLENYFVVVSEIDPSDIDSAFQRFSLKSANQLHVARLINHIERADQDIRDIATGSDDYERIYRGRYNLSMLLKKRVERTIDFPDERI